MCVSNTYVRGVFFVACGGLPDLFAHIDICVKTRTNTAEETS